MITQHCGAHHARERTWLIGLSSLIKTKNTEIVSSEASLEDCGVVGQECIIYYDFVPVSGALLR